MSPRNGSMTAADIARALLPHARAICRDCLPGGKAIGNEYHARNLTGGFRRPKPGQSANSLRVNLVKGLWADFAEPDTGGDLLALVAMTKTGGRIGPAIKHVRDTYLGPDPRQSPPPRPADRPRPRRDREDVARWLWRKAKPLAGSIGLRYLAARGLPPDYCASLDGLRFLDDAIHAETRERAPAILARIVDPAGKGRGLHRIFLAADGRSKYPNGSPRLGLGTLAGNALAIGDRSAAVAIAAESVEDGLAIGFATGARVLAAVSAKHLGMLTIPDGVTTLLAAGDNDREGLRAFQTLAKRYPGKRIVDAVPPTGVKDYNDLLRGQGPAAVKAHLRGRCRAAR